MASKSEEIGELLVALLRLLSTSQGVVNSWENGNLAQAVRSLKENSDAAAKVFHAHVPHRPFGECAKLLRKLCRSELGLPWNPESRMLFVEGDTRQERDRPILEFMYPDIERRTSFRGFTERSLSLAIAVPGGYLMPDANNYWTLVTVEPKPKKSK